MADNKFNDSPFIYQAKDKSETAKMLSDFDSIGMINFAESISSFIQDCTTPMTIGLQGDWGTGKTSLMNMLKCYIKGKNQYIIDLNTWHYSMFHQDQYLGLAVVKALIDGLQQKLDSLKTSSLTDNVKSSLFGILKRAVAVAKAIEIPGAGLSVKDIEEAVKSNRTDDLAFENISTLMLDFKKKFHEYIATAFKDDPNARVYYFIDDLDRIKPIKAIEVLETLKNFMDVEKCVFVLAVDYEVVQLGISQKFGEDLMKKSGKSFFDKIIQLPFAMPTASYNIEGYLKDLLESSDFCNFSRKIRTVKSKNTSDGTEETTTTVITNTEPETEVQKKEKSEDLKFYVEMTECTIGRNPRSIKRAINYASLLESIRQKNAKASDDKKRRTSQSSKLLYTIVCMQIAWPELFEYFILNPTPESIKNLENWDFLDNLAEAKKLFGRVSDIDTTKDNISAFFDTLYSILDTEDKHGQKGSDGIISKSELKPLLDILSLVKLTSGTKFNEDEENPKDKMFEKIKGNLSGKGEDIAAILNSFEKAFAKTYWNSSEDLQYRKAKERYHTIVYSRKQIGSIVSSKKDPFLLRLKHNQGEICDQLTIKYPAISNIIKPVDETVSGIGATKIDFRELSKLDIQTQIKILNDIFEIVTKPIK